MDPPSDEAAGASEAAAGLVSLHAETRSKQSKQRERPRFLVWDITWVRRRWSETDRPWIDENRAELGGSCPAYRCTCAALRGARGARWHLPCTTSLPREARSPLDRAYSRLHRRRG